MKTFIYKDELYIRVIPCKRLFHSTTVHEVVNRGDIFAMRVSDQQLTVIPGKAAVEHTQHVLIESGEGKQFPKAMETIRRASSQRSQLSLLLDPEK